MVTEVGPQDCRGPNPAQTTQNPDFIKLTKHKAKDLASQGADFRESTPGTWSPSESPVMASSQACGAHPAQNLKEDASPGSGLVGSRESINNGQD